ncbi:laminin subunit alpha-like [Haliotis cracherodii]|uniref:laminin subunit alpha-like n=1 Tax=Haliotis cracherodii TaxID=6455 RepID=UPI0039EA6C91
MAGGNPPLVCLILIFLCKIYTSNAQVLSPPYFNLAQGRNITASATCGEDVPNAELFCRLTGATGRGAESRELIQGQLCDYCAPEIYDQNHGPEYAIDGSQRWWQSPPLSRGVQYNEVNLTINLGQEFHVAYVFIKMANSPRPGVWVLERSTDFGTTYQPWQYFADSPSDCLKFFHTPANTSIGRDNQILCTTEFSKVVPLENGEIVVSLVNGRPNAQNFSYAYDLQEWTKATNIRMRLIRTKTLLGHLMAVARRDPTVTRRYYYSIKDISIGGRCVCNGHANTCDRPDQNDANKLLCNCVHNTCGDQCEYCCPGFVQKKWQRALADLRFECEPCQCYGHSNECVYNEEVDRLRQSIDIHGSYEGGGVCQNCRDNTMGNNCEQCTPGFFRPYGVPRNETNACRACQCDLRVSTGECEEGSGRCLCRTEYTGELCDRCSVGYYGYPSCIPCDCDFNGTEGSICTVQSGSCPCKPNFDGQKCDMCALGYYNFPTCQPCVCNSIGSPTTTCDISNGQCQCTQNYGSRDCSMCADGYFNFPNCDYCNCDPQGTKGEICDKQLGDCFCKPNFSGLQCDRCTPGYFSYPDCRECACADIGSISPICADSGQCRCRSNFGGYKCDRCAPGFYRYPDCVPCNCDLYGSLARTCDQTTGQCSCRRNFQGLMCDKCQEGLYNYPYCEECNCNPAGAKEIPGYPLGGCGTVTKGQLCECKDEVMGRICDTCNPGYWNLNRNNPSGCEECKCFRPGTLGAINVCDTNTGQCMCKPDTGGQNCDQCLDGYFGLMEGNPFGCQDCNCDVGGSITTSCNKNNGQCVCKPRVAGQKCDLPIESHFYPDLHQYKYEIEDGTTPEGAQIRYGYDERIFPGYSWRGYAILIDIQPEVVLDIYINKPSLYQIIYRYINRNDNTVKGEVTLSPDISTDIEQSSEIVLLPNRDPAFSKVGSTATGSTFVLNPGRWRISTKVPDSVFLDYFVLIPQGYYEASVLQKRIIQPCTVPGDQGPCLHYQYPDISWYPTVRGEDGYVIEDQQRVSVSLYPDGDVVDELGTTGMAHLNANQTFFYLDLVIPDPGDYVLVFNYHNPQGLVQNLDVDVASEAGRSKAKLRLNECMYSSLCRQVLNDELGMVAVFNISTGYVSLTIRGDDNVEAAIESVVAIPYGQWSTNYIRPRIICIKVNGVCIPSTYSSPVGSFRVDFEQSPNQDRLATELPYNMQDPNVGLVKLNSTSTTVEIEGQIDNPNQHVFVVHFYMPSEVGLTIPVTITAGDRQVIGYFTPQYCPSTSGCRGTIQFPDSGNFLSIKSPVVRMLFNNTQGGDIWLDYVLIAPANQYNMRNLDLHPIDKSGDFLTECVNDGFELRSNSKFCRESVFTLTSEFNNGALQCDCNIDGSLNFNCDQFGGQCQCRENVIGRNCTACKPGYFGFPRCKPCSCLYGLCHPLNGECICPTNVEGDRCDRCEPETYGFDALIGCQECKCNIQGVQGQDLNCDQTTGKCRCLPNVSGRKCDTCDPGHSIFPYCRQCDCDIRGTTVDICDQNSARCICKENVAGPRCDGCAADTYYLNQENLRGCTTCFCFGATTYCDSSPLFWNLVTQMNNWAVTNVNADVIEAGSTIAVKAANSIIDPTEAIYWVAPPEYLGNKIKSYGGYLMYQVLFTLPRDDEAQNSEGLVKPDVILVGNNMTIVHFSNDQPAPNSQVNLNVQLFEYNFVHANTRDTVTREQFMMLLINLQALHVRASYFTLIDEARLSEVQLEAATEEGQGDAALSVEQCQCPPNYQGSSCEECAPGYYRSRPTPYLGICVPCECNGHADSCDPITGECLNCQDNTTGLHCEACLTGYFGDPAFGGCQICACPLPLSSNNFAVSCVISDNGLTTFCECLPGYYGPNCESCASGHYGNPYKVGEGCQQCGCSGNINLNDPYSCDRYTGECLICLNNTAGSYCDSCQEWFYGDAIQRKNCASCACNQCGSESCDSGNGVCTCKPNVIGLDCDQCAPYTWGFEYCTGCNRCDCGSASISPQCDLRTGQCECQPNVLGQKCDQCQQGYWNYGSAGCQRCECMGDGAVTCDADTGRCQCLPGVTGEMCDRCLDRWVLIPEVGCQECGYCVHLLMDDLDFMDRNVTVSRRTLASVSVGVAAFQKLSDINQTIADLRPQVRNLYKNTDPIDVTPFVDEIEKLGENAMTTFNRAVTSVAEAKALEGEVDSLQTDAFDIERVIAHSAQEGSAAVTDINQVLERILAGIQVANIETYIREGERILQEIVSRDFSPRNESALMELMEAQTALNRSDQLQMAAAVQLELLTNIRDNITDAEARYKDLQNNTLFSDIDSRKAHELYDQLKNNDLAVLLEDIKDIHALEKNIIGVLDDANEMISGARDALNRSEDAFVALQDVAGQLDTAFVGMTESQGALTNKLQKLEPLVNQSMQKADDLEDQAEALDQMYTDTRQVAANAVQAANAYKDIVDAINSAEKASASAEQDGQDALTKSSGVGDKSAKSREGSITLFESADIANNYTKNDLLDRLNRAVTATASLDLMILKTEEDLDEVTAAFRDLPSRDSGDRAMKVTNESLDANSRAGGAQERVKSILFLLPEDKSKLEQLTNQKFATKRLLEGVQKQVNSARDVRRLTLLLTPLGEQARNMTGISSRVNINMAQLKEKIALARDEANRIRVGIRFVGNTSLTLRNPANLEQAGSYTKISLFFKTTQEDGLLYYMGGDQRSGRQDDYIALELVKGQAVFRFDLGSGPATIISPETYNDGQWHQLTATRIGKTGYLKIQTDKQEDDNVEGTSQGTFTVLGLHPATAVFYVGGAPTGVMLPSSINGRRYIGVMEDLKFDEQSLGLWNFIMAENNYYGENERDVMKSVSSNGLRFNGKGYVILSKAALGLRPDKTIDVILKFKTYAENGLLVYMADAKKDFLSLELRDGKLFFQFDLGSNRAVLMADNKFNDGQWHQLQASRVNNKGLLKVDGKTVDQGDAPGTLKQLSISDDIFIGGYNKILVPTNDVSSIGFDGCIKDIQFGTQTWDLNDNKRAIGVARGCPEQIARVASFTADRRGFVAVSSESIGQMFDITFKMRTFENESLILYAASSDQSSAFAVGIVQGRIVVTADPGGEMTTFKSKVNEYSDGKWHYVSIMKSGQKLTMNIDDLEMVDAPAEGDTMDLLTETPLYFGGLPPQYNIKPGMAPTTARFIGCIGDVTVNKRFVNFASIQESDRSGANLAGCLVSGELGVDIQLKPTSQTKPDIEEETVTETPDVAVPGQCALPDRPDMMAEGVIDGTRFGSTADSREEYKKLPSRFRIRSLFECHFKTTAEDGIIMYMADSRHIDHIALLIKGGQVVYSFNCGSGAAVVTSPNKYNDGQWHKVSFSRAQTLGTLEINGEIVGYGRSIGRTRSINVRTPYFVGGIPMDLKKKAANNLKDVSGSFIGCLKNFKINDKMFGAPSVQTAIKPCSNAMEAGSFFTADGGYVKLYDKFKVGLDLLIRVEIKPRSVTGLILAVHGRGDYLVLQMVDGKIILRADNGMGAITTSFTPSTSNSLCDGKWHVIKAIKAKEVVKLEVDGVTAPIGQGKPGVSAADTNDPLFIGGAPDYSAKGIDAKTSFVGCIRNVQLDGKMQYIGSGSAIGSVKMDSCPVN